MNKSDSQAEILRLALHVAPSGIVVVDERGAIVFANQTLADMFGHREQDLLGQPVEVLLPEQHAATHRHHVAHYAREPEPRPMGAGKDFEAVARDGRRFPVEIGLRPVITGGRRLVVATVIDITRRKAIEDKLREHEEHLERLVAERTRKLEQAQREKEEVLEHLIQAEKMTAIGTLVSGIGHEINNPLYVLSAMAEALSSEDDLVQCRAYAEEILKHAKHIGETVRNLSCYAQPSARHDLQRVDINESVSGAIGLARRSLRSDRIDIAAHTTPVPAILAKPEEIQQVLFNVIRNGIQAIREAGTIEVRTAYVEDRVVVRIRDSGPGIAERHLKQVFDPFFTTKGPDEGEGLGLYIVRQIVTQCAGQIEVENAAGGGAVFVIRFPVADPQDAKGKEA